MIIRRSSKIARIDPDSQNYLITAAITDSTIRTASNNLFYNAKQNGWQQLCNAMYLFAGSTSSTCKWNAIDMRDLDAAFRLNFIAAPTFAATGVTFNGSTQYADTFIVPNTTLSLNSSHLSIYSRTATDNLGASGIYESGVTQISIYRKYSADGKFYVGVHQAGQEAGVAVADGKGFYMGSRTASNVITGYKNSTAIVNGVTVSSSLSASKILLAANNTSGTAGEFDNVELTFATIGAGISATIAPKMYIDIYNFNSALGRA